MTNLDHPSPDNTDAKAQGPSWAEELVLRLRELELRLGNLKPADGWQSLTAEQLAARAGALNEEESSDDASLTETLFQRLCRGLSEEGFAEDAIASFINARLHTERLPYCNAAEVSEALHHS